MDQKYAIERLNKPELIFRYKTRAKFVCNTIEKHLEKKSGLQILDFGAAEGLTIREMDQILPGNTILGLEYTDDLIQKAPELPDNVKLIQGDVTRLDNELTNGQYDAISALALLEHLKEPEKALMEAKKALKPGGIFIATSPNPLWDDISTKLGLLRDEQHEVEINEKFMKDITEKTGFEWVQFKRFMWAPVSFLPYLNIGVSPVFSLDVDNFIENIKVFNWLFVNQAFILRKPQ